MMLSVRKSRTMGKRRPVGQVEGLTVTMQAPSGGLVETAATGNGCSVCENWLPTRRGYRVRGGKYPVADIGSPIVSMFSYQAASGNKMFAATLTAVYDVSALDPEATLTPAVSGLTAGYWCTAQLGTAGGEFLLAVNGKDNALIFNGTHWLPMTGDAIHLLAYDGGTGVFALGETVTGGTSGATAVVRGINGATASGTLIVDTVASGPFTNDEVLTGSVDGAAVANGSNSEAAPAFTGVGTDDLSAVWTHKNRFWLVEKGTQSAWYLAPNAFTGAATEFPLAGVFKLGGELLFGATWSADSGAGMDDRQVFVSALGEVAVYEGTDPSSPTTWGLVGLYMMDPPLGPKAHVRAGGDILIATAGGMVALSSVFQKDPAALRLTAISAPVERTWSAWASVSVLTSPWEAIVWPDGGLLMVSLPDSHDRVLVASLETGGWGTYYGWDVQCMARFGKSLFFGSDDGHVYQAERGGDDAGSPYVCRLSYLPNDLDAPGAFKTANAMRATFYSGVPLTPKLSVASHYSRSFPPAPPASVMGGTAGSDGIWDVGLFDQAVWDTASLDFYNVTARVTKWVSQGGVGVTLAPQVQVTISGTRRPNIELLSVDLIYSTGAVAA